MGEPLGIPLDSLPPDVRDAIVLHAEAEALADEMQGALARQIGQKLRRELETKLFGGPPGGPHDG